MKIINLASKIVEQQFGEWGSNGKNFIPAYVKVVLTGEKYCIEAYAACPTSDTTEESLGFIWLTQRRHGDLFAFRFLLFPVEEIGQKLLEDVIKEIGEDSILRGLREAARLFAVKANNELKRLNAERRRINKEAKMILRFEKKLHKLAKGKEI